MSTYNHYNRERQSVKMFDNFLNEIDHIAYERDYWKAQAEEWEKKYRDLLSESARYMNEVSGQILTAFLHKPDTDSQQLSKKGKKGKKGKYTAPVPPKPQAPRVIKESEQPKITPPSKNRGK